MEFSSNLFSHSVLIFISLPSDLMFSLCHYNCLLQQDLFWWAWICKSSSFHFSGQGFVVASFPSVLTSLGMKRLFPPKSGWLRWSDSFFPVTWILSKTLLISSGTCLQRYLLIYTSHWMGIFLLPLGEQGVLLLSQGESVRCGGSSTMRGFTRGLLAMWDFIHRVLYQYRVLS